MKFKSLTIEMQMQTYLLVSMIHDIYQKYILMNYKKVEEFFFINKWFSLSD